MEDIEQERLDNEGGVEVVRFAPLDYLSKLPEPIDAVLEESVEFKSGRGWLTVGAVRGSVLYDEQEDAAGDDVIYRPKLTMVVARYSNDIARATLRMNNYPLVFLIKDNNGLWLLIGTEEEPVRKLTRKVTTGGVPGDRNQAMLEFGADGMRHGAVHYVGVV